MANTTAGTTTSSIAAGGGRNPINPAAQSISEEFTGETETATASTLTTS